MAGGRVLVAGGAGFIGRAIARELTGLDKTTVWFARERSQRATAPCPSLFVASSAVA